MNTLLTNLWNIKIKSLEIYCKIKPGTTSVEFYIYWRKFHHFTHENYNFQVGFIDCPFLKKIIIINVYIGHRNNQKLVIELLIHYIRYIYIYI